MYYTLFFNGLRVGCYLVPADLIEYVQRSILGGCSPIGWSVISPSGRKLSVIADMTVHLRFSEVAKLATNN